MRKDPTEFRKRFQSWKLGIPAYRAGKPIGEDEDTRSDTTRQGYHEGDIRWGAGNDAAGQGPMWLLENVGAGMGNSNLITGHAPAVGMKANVTNRIIAGTRKYAGRVDTKKLSPAYKEIEARYGDTYNPDELEIWQKNAMPLIRRDAIKKYNGEYVLEDGNNFILMKNRKSIADARANSEDGILSPEMVYKSDPTERHVTRRLYSGMVEREIQGGGKGVASGEFSVAWPATGKEIENFERTHLGNYGVHENTNLVPENAPTRIVHSEAEAKAVNARGERYVYENAPVYLLTKPAVKIPVKNRNVFDPRTLDANGVHVPDFNSRSRFQVLLPFAVGGSLWANEEYKNGKDLPRFAGGVDLGANPTNATINNDGTFTDDYTHIFDDFIITPKGATTKYGSYTDLNWSRYKQYSNWLKYHDQKTGKLTGEPGLELVSPEFDLLSLGIGVSKELSRAHNWGGVRLTPFSNNDKFSYEYLNHKGNPVGYINVTTYGNKPHISMVRSSIENKGISRKLYDAAIQDVTDRGMPGIYSGDNLLSAPKTYAMWKHYPNKKLIRMDGTHNNSQMPGVTGVLSRDMTRELAIQNWKNNKFGIIENGEVYLLDSPSAPVQYWSPYQISFSNPAISTGNILLGHSLLGDVNYKSGKDIYIKPSHHGRFTALKKRTGHSTSWFKAHGTPALKKMATFALNAKKWKH